MSEAFLIDTSVFVEAEADPALLLAWLAETDDVATSEAVLAEFSVGLHAPSDAATRERARKYFQEYILPLPALPVLSQDYRDAGRLIGEAIRQGKARPGLADALIALCALRENRTVATMDPKDFKAMGVRVCNPFAK